MNENAYSSGSVLDDFNRNVKSLSKVSNEAKENVKFLTTL